MVFQPGVNEELAATAVWGSQQLDLYPEQRRFDGVFGLWYGKGPGVDRCSDVFKHANMAGTARHGGVIAGGRRRPCGQEQHRGPPERPHLQGLRPASVLSVQCAGDPRPGAARLGDEPLFGAVGGAQDHPGGGGVGHHGGGGSAPRADPAARRLPHAPGRAAHPLARCAAGAGSPADGPQVVCRAGLHPRQPPEPHGDRQPACAPGPDRQRQGLQRHPPGPP